MAKERKEEHPCARKVGSQEVHEVGLISTLTLLKSPQWSPSIIVFGLAGGMARRRSGCTMLRPKSVAMPSDMAVNRYIDKLF